MNYRTYIGLTISEALLKGKTVDLGRLGVLTCKRFPASRKSDDETTSWRPPRVDLEHWSDMDEASEYGPTGGEVVTLPKLLSHSPKAGLPAGKTIEDVPALLFDELHRSGWLDIPHVGRFLWDKDQALFTASADISRSLNAAFESLPLIPASGPAVRPSAVSLHESDAEDSEAESGADETEAGPAMLAATDVEQEAHEVTATTVPVQEEPPHPKRDLSSRSRSRFASPSARRAERQGSSRGALLLIAGMALIFVIVLFAWPFIQGMSTESSSDDTMAVLDSMDYLNQDSLLGAAPDSTRSDSSLATLGAPSRLPGSNTPSLPSGTALSKPVVPPVTSSATTQKAQSGSTAGDKIFPPETKGYTIIVRSALNRATAEAVQTEYAFLNLPMGVLTSQVDGVTRYRMGLGVYGSAFTADSVRKSLSAQIPSDSWVFRIR